MTSERLTSNFKGNSGLMAVYQQLANRERTSHKVFGSKRSAEIASNLDNLISEISEFPAGRLLPLDPLKLLLLEDMIEVDLELFVLKKYRVDLDVSKLKEQTFGYLVQLIESSSVQGQG